MTSKLTNNMIDIEERDVAQGEMPNTLEQLNKTMSLIFV
jgi:hypothetical protein